jgi:ribonuclease HI
MLVTINTDASFNPVLKVGAYAFWIVCDQGRIMNSGVLKGEIGNSTEAEVRCIVNALHALYRARFSNVHKVIINTDCLHFHSYIGKRKRKEVSSVFQSIASRIASEYALKSGWIEFRHVKAHSGKAEKRKWVNDWCDKKAKEALKQMKTKNKN